MKRDELVAFLVLNRVTNFTERQKAELFERYGSALGIFASVKEVEGLCGKPFKINGAPLRFDLEAESAAKELEYYENRGVVVIGIADEDYPVRLKQVYDPPLVLFAMGRADLLRAEVAVGVVGARKASNAAITLAYSLARDLSTAGAVVVSGLAAGVDHYAHKGALDGEGSTVAVLGNGIDVVYPRENGGMYRRVEKEGCLLSEFPMGTSPLKQNFPRRNRVISGLSLGVVVVEAEEGSGALITAEHALEQGREVMAFPGRAGADAIGGAGRGNNRLIKDGAHLVEGASDVLELLGRNGVRPQDRVGAFSPLGRDILRVIGEERVSIEAIERALRCPVSRIASELTMLEIRGEVDQHPGKIYSRVYRHGK